MSFGYEIRSVFGKVIPKAASKFRGIQIPFPK